TQWRGGQTNNNPSVSSRHLPLAEAAGAENYTPPEKGERASSLARGSDFTQSPAFLVKTHDGTLEILEWEIV
ncbi:MAG: hypothetical protein II876_09740, partial [Synergistaceae bacterium]|nr:hypothetical protein [Synergistaceae bacterium]